MTLENKKFIIATFGFLVSVVSVSGQEKMPPPPPQMQPFSGPPPPGLPIDNGLIILFIVALVFGIYKILKYKKDQEQA